MINDSGYFYPDETGACDTRYDLSVNSSKLGIDRTVDLLETYVRARMEG